MGINKKVQSELSNINVRKKVQLANDLTFHRFTTKHVRLTIMLVTGLESVIVRNLVKYKYYSTRVRCTISPFYAHKRE